MQMMLRKAEKIRKQNIFVYCEIYRFLSIYRHLDHKSLQEESLIFIY